VSLGVTHLRFWAGFRSGTPAGATEHISPNLVLSCMIYVFGACDNSLHHGCLARRPNCEYSCTYLRRRRAHHREVGPTRIPIILVSTVRVVLCVGWALVHHGRTRQVVDHCRCCCCCWCVLLKPPYTHNRIYIHKNTMHHHPPVPSSSRFVRVWYLVCTTLVVWSFVLHNVDVVQVG
jgi:hypothetical protein